MNRISPYPTVQGGRGARRNHSDEPGVSGESLEMVVASRFLKDEDVEGIRLVQDLGTVKKLKIKLGNLNHGPHNSFPVNKPMPLNKRHFLPAEIIEPYVVAPKPLGIRYLLYVNQEGKIYMENETQHIFEMEQDRISQLIPNDTVLDGIVVRKIVRDGAAQNSNAEAKGKLTFVIMDATRVSGVDLVRKTFQERISVAKASIVQPRLDASVSRTDGDDVMDLDIAKYEALSHMEEYLSPGFKQHFEYPIGSFLFKPLSETYRHGKKGKPVLEWDESRSEEFTFRLKIISDDQRQTTGYLFAVGSKPKGVEAKAASIDLTDELRALDGVIIECRNVDRRWFFVRVRNDCEHPNVHIWMSGKIKAPVSGEFLLDALRKYLNEN